MPLIVNEHGEFVDGYEPYAPMKLHFENVVQNRGKYEKVCPQCFKRFRTDAPHKVYCSGTCADNAKRERRVSEQNARNVASRKKRTRECDICGKEYAAHSSTSKYCSDGCRKAAEKKRKEAKRCES